MHTNTRPASENNDAIYFFIVAEFKLGVAVGLVPVALVVGIASHSVPLSSLSQFPALFAMGFVVLHTGKQTLRGNPEAARFFIFGSGLLMAFLAVAVGILDSLIPGAD